MNNDDDFYEGYAFVKLLELIVKGINYILKVIVTAIVTIILFIPRIIKKYKIKKTQEKFIFNEFEDVGNIKQKDDNSIEQLNNELKVLNEIAYDVYKDKGNNIFDVAREQRKAVRDMHNFEFLDSVEVNDENNEEGVHVNKIKEKVNEFEAELFKMWSVQIFKCIKLGKKEELEIVKEFITDQMYERLIYQKKNFEKDGLEFITEDLIIKDVTIADYAEAMDKEEIKICIEANMKEYILDKNTQRVIRGSNKKTYEKKNIMTFLKQNIISKEGFVTNCPNCGAESAQVEFGRCRYCDTLVFPIRYNWTLIKFETI